MNNFVKYVGRLSNSQDFEGDSRIVSFTVLSSTVSYLDRGKGGKFGMDISVCFFHREDIRRQVISIISNFLYFVLKSS